ncbi:junctophilin-1 isoform X1 [Agrilus planipennis]|uniref:Junctophilin-1 isoform X1 n=1 Tax=Agrilus planipennis TaxID=224129 RepID=A0A7F5RHH4_AGRPL|nr:junctophilin-1 isoform X1 [Agrilus planipennis]
MQQANQQHVGSGGGAGGDANGGTSAGGLITSPAATGATGTATAAKSNMNGGRFDFDDGGTYCGGWEDGKAHGHGVCTGPKGQGAYSGSWHYGFEVSGVYTWPSGSAYEGQWQNGKRHGLGVETRGRWVYRGEWTQGFKGRYGVRQSNTSTAKYEGTWANGLQDGYGSETYADDGTYQGQWLRGMRHGYGVRNSAPFGKASKYRNKTLRASLTSLRSNEATAGAATAGANAADPAEKRDRRVDDSRGGFVLVVNSDEPQRRRSLGEKSIKRSLLMGLKLKKQKSTGDLEKGTGSIRSTGSSASWVSTDSAQSAITNASLHTDSNASFIVEDDQMDASVTETYMGEWKNDKRTGFGISERSDGLKYEGEWYANKKYGYGVTTFSNGEKEEGKYKNNVLITSNKKKHLFLMRSAKFRERIDAAVNAAQRASKIALQKADIAISRTATARGKAEQADVAAAHAREDSDIALAVAKQFAPDFKQPGLERFRARYNKDRYTDSAYSSQKDSSLSSSIANQFISEYAQNQVSNKIPNHVTPEMKVGNKMPPMGNQIPNQIPNQMTNPLTNEMQNMQHLQQQNVQNTTSNFISNQSQQHNLAPNPSQNVMPNQPYPNQSHNKSNQSNNLLPNQSQQMNFNSTMHNNKSIYGYELDNQISNVQKTQTRTTSVYSKPPPPQTNDYSNQNANPATNEDINRVRNSIPREEYSQANLRRNSRRVSGDRPYLGQTQQQSSIDYFDHYKRPPSRDSSVDRYTKAASRLSGSRQPSVDKTFIPAPETPERTSRAPSAARGTPPVQTPAASRNGAIMTGNPGKTINTSSSRATTPTQAPFEEIIIRKRGLGQDIIPSPNQPKRTESLYNPNPAPTVKTIVEQTSLQRKKSLPDVQTLPKATEPMSREEVSYLGSMRREEVRRMNEEREKLRANPLLYLVSPQVKDWFSRQQLVIVVLFINISLAIMFFKILT